ncbi:hypothetical protein [Erwinia psidii]|nr:hypothetical protein [Erwinia psidii]
MLTGFLAHHRVDECCTAMRYQQGSEKKAWRDASTPVATQSC